MFTIEDGVVDVEAGKVDDPEVTMVTSYEPLVAAGDGRMSLQDFAANHLHFETEDSHKARALMTVLGRAMSGLEG